MNIIKLSIFIFGIFILISGCSNLDEQNFHSIADWNFKAFGNHRVVVDVANSAEAVWVHFDWRRQDLHPENVEVIAIDARTGERVKNIFRVSVNRECGDFIFEPISAPGKYYFYYLPFEKDSSRIAYLKPEKTASSKWLQNFGLDVKTPALEDLIVFPKANVIQFQSVDENSSFFPMEICATQQETKSLLAKNKDASYLIFPEYRDYPIKMLHDLPKRWIDKGVGYDLIDTVKRGEFYTFQIGVFAVSKNLRDVTIQFGDLKNEYDLLKKSYFTCFNNTGVNHKGEDVEYLATVDKGYINPFWCGLKLPENMKAGMYSALITVKPYGAEEQKFKLNLYIDGQIIEDNDSPNSLSKLRWLNSQLTADYGIVAPFRALEHKDSLIRCLGRDVVLTSSGFPKTIKSYFNESLTTISDSAIEIISKPIKFKVEKMDYSIDPFRAVKMKFIEDEAGVVAWQAKNESELFDMDLEGTMDFDGCITYNITMIARKDVEIRDLKMKIPIDKKVGKYMMGLGVEGGKIKPLHSWTWDKSKNQDAVWVGTVNGGLQFTMWGDNYVRPLNTKHYLKKPLNMPKSWYNDGKGGCDIDSKGDVCAIKIYTGKRKVMKGEILNFNFRLMVSPFKTINIKEHWLAKNYYNSTDGEINTYNANTINIGKGTAFNKLSDYPFAYIDTLKYFVDKAHAENKKVKYQYSNNSISNRAVELYALRSLGNEIIANGNDNGSSWLKEHFDSQYIVDHFAEEDNTASIVANGASRWNNYYIEGVNWLFNNVKLDGLFLEDITFDRIITKRLRKLLYRKNNEAQVDLMLSNQYNKACGYASSVNINMEHLPYIDRISVDKNYNYKASPDYWLIEMAGIPFGTMSQMEGGSENIWKGLLYGMLNSYPKYSDAEKIWEAFDRFGIANTEMIGYWVTNSPVKTNNKNVLATLYKGTKKSLLVIANWESTEEQFDLNIDWEYFGINSKKTELNALEVRDLQKKASYDIKHKISLLPNKGLLLVIE